MGTSILIACHPTFPTRILSRSTIMASCMTHKFAHFHSDGYMGGSYGQNYFECIWTINVVHIYYIVSSQLDNLHLSGII